MRTIEPRASSRSLDETTAWATWSKATGHIGFLFLGFQQLDIVYGDGRLVGDALQDRQALVEEGFNRFAAGQGRAAVIDQQHPKHLAARHQRHQHRKPRLVPPVCLSARDKGCSVRRWSSSPPYKITGWRSATR